MTQKDCQEYRFTQNHIFGIQSCKICQNQQIIQKENLKQTKKKTMKIQSEDYSLENKQVSQDLPVHKAQDFNPAPQIQPYQETFSEYQQQFNETSQNFQLDIENQYQPQQSTQGFNPYEKENLQTSQQSQQQYFIQEYQQQLIDNYTQYYNQMQQQQMHQQMYQQPGKHQQNLDQQNFQQYYDFQNDDEESVDEDIIKQCMSCDCCKGDVYGCQGETCIMLGSCYCLMKLEMEKNAEDEEINKFFVEEMQKKHAEENYQQ